MQDATRDQAELTIEEVRAMTGKALKATLKDLGEKTGGNKAALVVRLWRRVHGGDPPAVETDGDPPGDKPLDEARGKPTGKELEDERQRRLELEALHGTLGRKRCRHCGTIGAWKVYNIEPKQKRTRYIRCIGCGAADQAPVIVKEKERIDAIRRN